MGADLGQLRCGNFFLTCENAWLNHLVKGEKLEIDVYRGAEMTAPGILAVEAQDEKKVKEIPNFTQ